jgi:hypothetical protein
MGVLIGQNVPTPGLAFSLGVASHFMLDLIPHGDSQLYKNYKDGYAVRRSMAYAAIDSVVAIIVFIYLLENASYASRATMVSGVVGAIIPDFLVALGEGVRIRALQWFQRLHIRIHDAIANRIGNIPLGAGVPMQLILLFIMLFLAKR